MWFEVWKLTKMIGAQMKRVDYQVGFSHVAVIIVLVLALLATLGFVFWQNFVRNDDAQANAETSKANDASSPASSVTTKESCLLYEKMCFSHPPSWAYSSKQGEIDYGDGTVIKTENGTLAKKSGALKLFASTGITGIGGTCDPSQNTGYFVTLESKEINVPVERSPDEQYLTENLHVVRAIEVSPDTNSYTAQVLLSDSTELAKAGRHEPCTTMYASLFKQQKEHAMSFGTISFGFTDAPSEAAKTYGSYDEAKRAAQSSEYNEAFEILKSARY
jgi:hypothetical protein